MTSKFILAIMWTIVLIMDIVSACSGGEPSWLLVFCPLSILVLRYWFDIISDEN